MGEYLKRCETVPMKGRAMEEDMQLIFSKKRKVYSELENEYCGDVELAENSVSPASSRTSGCSKHDESNDVYKKSLRSPDLEVRIQNSNPVLDSVVSVKKCSVAFSFLKLKLQQFF